MRPMLPILVGRLVAVLALVLTASALAADSRPAEHPLRGRRRLVVRPRRRLRLPLGEDARLRPRRARGRALHPRLHAERQVRALALLHPHRAQSLAAQGRRQSRSFFPAGVSQLSARRSASLGTSSASPRKAGRRASRSRKPASRALLTGRPFQAPQAHAAHQRHQRQ